MSSVRIAVALSLGALGCGKARPPEPQALSTLHMVSVVEATNGARLAVVAGHQPRARAHLAWLADEGFEVRDVDKSLRDHAERLVADARAGSEATSLEALGQAVARVGGSCGACHADIGLGPQFAKAEVAAGATVRAHMARHQWGVDTLWEGLVTPNEEMWKEGALTFFEIPVDPKHNPVIPQEFAPLVERVHDLGTESLGVVDRASRAEHYGALITTCGTCHQALGGPSSPAAP